MQVLFTRLPNVAQATDLKKKFIALLEMYPKGSFFSQLGNGISSNHGVWKNIKCIIHQSEEQGLYLITIKGINDDHLIKLAKEISLPRGFPIIWDEKYNEIFASGFYPKFANDTRQLAFDMSDFQNETKISFFRKYSGFLSGLIVWKRREMDAVQYTVVSKNSADSLSPFIQDALRLWQPYINRTMLCKLLNDNIGSVWAETMSKNDITHGSNVICEGIVVTAIAHSIMPEQLVPKWLTLENVHAFCKFTGMPSDCPIIITGADAVNVFITKLSEERDLTTEFTFASLLKSMNVDEQSLQKDLLGDTLEGLVIHCSTTNKVIKYKFPEYTHRTFMLRTFLSEENGKFVSPMDGLNVSSVYITKCEEYLNRWVTTDTGRQYWMQVLLLEAHATCKVDPIPGIGYHITVADAVKAQISEDSTLMQKSLISTVTYKTVILIVGPVGFGKTSLANTMVSMNPDSFEHIDGDCPCNISLSDTLKLGQERQFITWWGILRCLMSGKTPISTSGGGVLFQQGKIPKFTLRDQLQKALGCVINLVIVHPNKDEYKNSEKVATVVTDRLKRNEWVLPAGQTVDKFVNSIQKLSSNNLMFMFELLKCKTSKDISIEHTSFRPEYTLPAPSQLFNIVMKCKKEACTKGTIKQLREVFFVTAQNKIPQQLTRYIEKGFHRTHMYTSSGTSIDHTQVSQTSSCVNSGTLLCFENQVTLVVLHDLSDPCAHITLNSGNHSAMQMKNIAIAYNLKRESTCCLLDNSEQNVDYSFTVKEKHICLKYELLVNLQSLLSIGIM
jgi:hypothetical protein